MIETTLMRPPLLAVGDEETASIRAALVDRRPALMPGALAGRVVLVTGSSRGIGAEIAAKAGGRRGQRSPSTTTTPRMARAERSNAPAQRASRRRRSQADSGRWPAGGAAWSSRRSSASVGSMAWSTTPAERRSARSSRSPGDEWELVLATDLSASFHTCRAVLPSMVERGSGAIVNICSRLGQMGIAETAAYSAAKAGLIGLTRSLAREFGPRGIRINAVAPGLTVTDMTADLVDSETGRQRLRDMPLGRFGQPDEIADAVIFLLSDASSLFLGQTLNPNAGGYMP